MAAHNSTDSHVCIIDKTGAFQIILMFFALPFHVFVIKILAKEIKLHKPRHKILYSLSLSDAAVTFGLFILALVNKTTNFTLGSTGCNVYRGITILITCSTLVVSSVSIVTMSVERYIACIHSLRLPQILTASRIHYGAISTRLLGAIISIIAASTNHYDDTLMIPNSSMIQYIYLFFVIPISFAVIFIQVRLFIFSKKRRNRIIPVKACGAKSELLNHKKKQIRIAFMAGIVAAAFVACMIPLAVVFLYELRSGVTVSASYRSVCLSLSFSNGFADPFIYGFGMADTRQKMLRDLRKLKQFILEMLPENTCQKA